MELFPALAGPVFARCSLSSSPLCLPCVGAAVGGTSSAYPEVPQSLALTSSYSHPLVLERDGRIHGNKSSLRWCLHGCACSVLPCSGRAWFHSPARDAWSSHCPVPWLSHCFPWDATASPAGRRARKIFPVLEGKLCWAFSLQARLSSSSSGPAPPPPLPFQAHR